MKPLSTVELFLPLQRELVGLLRGLSPGEWLLPTVAAPWKVKDVAAHILDGDLRRLSIHRDGHRVAPAGSPAPDYAELVRFLNGLNASWVDSAARLSPRLIADLLEWSGPQVADFFASLPPEGEAIFPVAWAGEDSSSNWMDVGRDYTEKWHHQAQIRDAVGAPPLAGRRWLGPVIELSMYALPHAFRDSGAPDGAVVSVHVEGEAGGLWHLIREAGRWRLTDACDLPPSASVRLSADAAWRLFFNALDAEEARSRVESSGDERLCETFLAARAVMV